MRRQLPLHAEDIGVRATEILGPDTPHICSRSRPCPQRAAPSPVSAGGIQWQRSSRGLMVCPEPLWRGCRGSLREDHLRAAHSGVHPSKSESKAPSAVLLGIPTERKGRWPSPEEGPSQGVMEKFRPTLTTWLHWERQHLPDQVQEEVALNLCPAGVWCLVSRRAEPEGTGQDCTPFPGGSVTPERPDQADT